MLESLPIPPRIRLNPTLLPYKIRLLPRRDCFRFSLRVPLTAGTKGVGGAPVWSVRRSGVSNADPVPGRFAASQRPLIIGPEDRIDAIKAFQFAVIWPTSPQSILKLPVYSRSAHCWPVRMVMQDADPKRERSGP